MRYVIIGASAAGLAAAETLRRQAPASPITVISEEAQPLYSRPLLTYLLSGEVRPDAVWLRGPDYFWDWELTPLLGEAVVQVDPEQHEVRLASGRVISYDRLLIASGARPRLPGLPGEDLAGVFTLRTLTDWQRLDAGLAAVAGPAVVVGAGAVGCKAAEALAHRGRPVVLLEAESQALPGILDATGAGLLHQALARLGVELFLQAPPAAFLGRRGRVTAVALADGREFPAAAVLLATGVVPNVDFLAGTNLGGPRGLEVNAHMQTTDPDIYAAGDCARAPHFLTGRPAYYPIWPAAAAGGRVAGANLAGAGLSFPGLLPQNSLSLPGFSLIVGGLAPEECQDCEVVSELDARRGHYRRLVYREGRLVALTLVGDVADAGFYFSLMAQQLPFRGGPPEFWERATETWRPTPP